ncbi:MAG: protein TolR [Alphaproteobacteria bacterium]|nr:protein TolR [Alphaproteobacteria bacterium]
MGASMQKRGGGRRNRRGGFSEINVTPFVDVMLVLLIIFMVAAPMLTAGVEVDLPETKAAPVSGNDEPLTVSINRKGEVYVQDTKYPLSEIQSKLQAIAGQNKEKRIFVKGDSAVDYGVIMKVVGEINAAGFMKVALLTDVESTPAKRR